MENLSDDGRALLVKALIASGWLKDTSSRRALIEQIRRDVSQFKLDEGTPQIFAINLAYDLDTAGDQEGLRRLVELIYPNLPGFVDDEKQLRKLLGIGIEPSRPTPQAQGISKGLKALEELVRQDREVREAMGGVRAQFEFTCGQIKILSDYKDMHDQLHMLQFQCYNNIVPYTKRFPDSEEEVESLRDYEVTLQGIVNRLREIASQEIFAAFQTAWIQQLADAQKKLHTVIENGDLEHLSNVVNQIKRVLSRHPSDINARLNATARTLSLPTLVQAMEKARSNLTCFQVDIEKKRQFEEGVKDLSDLKDKLASLVHNHDVLQSVDLHLRRIESLLQTDLNELEDDWPFLKDMTQNFSSGRTEELVITFKTDGERLGQAIADGDPAKIRQCFRRYRRQAGELFLAADTRLKGFCDELREFDGPLASLVRSIQ